MCTLAVVVSAHKRVDWTGIATSVFRPARTQLARARAVLGPWFAREASASDPAERLAIVEEAWESCAAAGLVPIEWSGGDRRWVQLDGALVAAQSAGWSSFDAPGCQTVLAHPPSIASCLAMASHPEGIVAAEQLARAVADALGQWQQRPVESSQTWRESTYGPAQYGEIAVVLPAEAIAYERAYLLGEKAFSAAISGRAPMGWPLYVARLAKSSALLDAVIAARHKRVTMGGDRDVPIIDVESPFQRAAELFAMGYGVELSTRDRALRLVYAPVR